MDKNGWVNVAALLQAAAAYGQNIDQERLIEIFEINDKRRFSCSDDGTKIRAKQGRSVKNIDLELPSSLPPDVLYSGTVQKFLPSMPEDGLSKMPRQHVHLSTNAKTAIKVGQLRGRRS